MGFADREKKRTAGNGVAASMFSKDVMNGAALSEKETKKRYNLSLLPSVYEDLQKIAYVERRSVSEIVGELMDEYVKKNADKVDEYNQVK
jgi:hypothetical protein